MLIFSLNIWINRYVENRVFASLANGDVIVYYRDTSNLILKSHQGKFDQLDFFWEPGGAWNINEPQVITIGSVVAPVTRMLHVNNSHLWCSSQNSVKIIEILSMCIQVF